MYPIGRYIKILFGIASNISEVNYKKTDSRKPKVLEYHSVRGGGFILYLLMVKIEA
jgi:hypothetical protein